MKTWLSLLNTRSYWLSVSVLSLGLLGVALYYQHGLGEAPCQVCVQIRLWVVAIAVVGMLMAFIPGGAITETAGSALLLICSIGLVERSWLLYQLENGRGDGSCEFQLGMPDWFAVDRWFPEIFEVRNLCSFTPEIFLGISMAESLLLIGVIGNAAGLAGLAKAHLPRNVDVSHH